MQVQALLSCLQQQQHQQQQQGEEVDGEQEEEDSGEGSASPSAQDSWAHQAPGSTPSSEAAPDAGGAADSP